MRLTIKEINENLFKNLFLQNFNYKNIFENFYKHNEKSIEMRKFELFATITIVLFLICSCDQQNTISDQSDIEQSEVQKKNSLWTDENKEEFINTYAKTQFDRFVLGELIAKYEFERTYKEIEGALENQSFQDFKNYHIRKYIVNIDEIAGKTPSEVKLILGEPSKKEISNPSGTPCPCDKYDYLKGLIEIIYMNGTADWITINNSSSFYKSSRENTYLSFQRFSDYGFVKVSVK